MILPERKASSRNVYCHRRFRNVTVYRWLEAPFTVLPQISTMASVVLVNFADYQNISQKMRKDLR